VSHAEEKVSYPHERERSSLRTVSRRQWFDPALSRRRIP
jgi:hypothetical protein